MMVRKPRKRYESGLDYTKDEEENSKILLKEKYQLLKWNDSIEIKTPNLFIPAQIANFVGSLPFCKLAVSPHADRIAVINHNRLLNIYALEGESVVQESSVQVLEDDFAEYCLLEFSSSGSLILSTRSSAQIDVFDHTGGYCYDIPLEGPEHNVDLMCAVSCIRITVNNSSTSDDKYMDILYVLQFNGTFSVFKIGRLTRYYKMWSVSLDIGLAGAFTVLPDFNLLLVSSHYRTVGEVKPPGGLCSFRLIDTDPYVEPIRVATENGGWLSRLPFSSSNFAFISSLSMSMRTEKKLAAVATNGDFFVFDVPSTNLALKVEYISGPRPVQAVFVEKDELAILFDNGDFLRTPLSDAREAIHSVAKSDSFTPRTTLVVPTSRELFILAGDVGSNALREVANQRTSLAFRLWIYTLWSSFKQLVGMAVGDAAAPLQMATYSENLGFTLWHSPTRTLQQLFERTLDQRNYSLAKELAASYHTIDADIILKREWRDVCYAGTVTVEQVNEILKQIGDEEWIAEACATTDAPSLDVQIALVDLGASLVYITDASKIKILHNGRVLSVCEDVSLYLELREKSCLDVAMEFAKRGDFVILERLIAQNFELLSPYVLAILSNAPPSISATRFEQLLPMKNGKMVQIDELPHARSTELHKMSDENSGNAEIVTSLNIGTNEARMSSTDDFVPWVMQRAIQIDEECGIPDHSLALINIAIQHGYQELSNDLEKWKFYGSYVSMCSLVNETFEGFNASTAEHLLHHIGKLTESELASQAEVIVSLLEWRLGAVGTETRLREVIRPLLISSTETTTRVLKSFRQVRPNIVQEELIVECLCNLSLTGNELINAVRSVGVCPEMCSSLRSLSDRNVRPTFRRLWESTSDAGLARGVLTQVASCGQAETVDEWETLVDDVKQLAESLYTKLLSREAVFELLARELLSDERCGRDMTMLNSMLTLTKKGSRECDGLKLGWERSAEILLAKSGDAMQDAVTAGDRHLSLSRFLAEVAKEIAPKLAAEQLKLLDIIDLVHDLGMDIMPVNVKFADPNDLLRDAIHTDSNYRQGKKCAKLAVLLGVSTPVATALSQCALIALREYDENCLKKYISDVMAKAKDIHVVHQLCVKIMESDYVPAVMDDIYACALLNSPEAELEATMELINTHRRSRLAGRIERVELTDQLVTDSMYTPVDRFIRPEPLSEHIKFSLNNTRSDMTKPAELAVLLSRHSATTGLSVSLFGVDDEDSEPWTNNDTLQRYEKALRLLRPQLNGRLVEGIHPSALIKFAFADDKTETAMDRIGSYGVDRTRFIEDSSYRKETIVGLAMSEDEIMFSDAVSLASDFKMDEWEVHMASLENALTTCTIAETKAILKNRGHLSKLKTNLEKFHDALRSSVLPLLDTNDRFIAYLSLFADGQPEKAASPTLKKLLEKKKELNGRRLFTDVDYLSDVINSMPDKYILALADGIRSMPVGVEACERSAAELLNGTDLRPPAGIAVLFMLLGNDEVVLLELVASKPLTEEISYLEMSVMVLDATPGSSEALKTAVRDRLSLLTSSVEEPAASSSPEPSFGSSVISRRRH